MTLRLVGILLRRCQSEHAKDVEIAVLRHQLQVLRRQVKRPAFHPADRALLALLSSALPRERWSIFLVTPGHDLAVHRRLTRRLAEVDVELARLGALRTTLAGLLAQAPEAVCTATTASQWWCVQAFSRASDTQGRDMKGGGGDGGVPELRLPMR